MTGAEIAELVTGALPGIGGVISAIIQAAQARAAGDAAATAAAEADADQKFADLKATVAGIADQLIANRAAADAAAPKV